MAGAYKRGTRALDHRPSGPVPRGLGFTLKAIWCLRGILSNGMAESYLSSGTLTGCSVTWRRKMGIRGNEDMQ